MVWLLGDWEFDERPITYTALDTYMSKLADHYYETRVCVKFSKIYEFGCGMLSFPYCEGTVVRNYNPGRGIMLCGVRLISDYRVNLLNYCLCQSPQRRLGNRHHADKLFQYIFKR